ncbi:MAG: triose-phosphate isomerase [Candidatus Micrarchaeia archaeon]
MEPLIVLNLKTYHESIGERGVALCRIADEVAEETGASIIVAPQNTDLFRIAKEVAIPVFAQHIDANEAGAFTGSITAEAVKEAGCKGSLLNHSERKIEFEKIQIAIQIARKVGIELLLCADSIDEAKRIAPLKPDYIAVEPPELIGSGISVSKAKPEVVSGAVEEVKKIAEIPVLCGAGISDGEDVQKAIQLGADGVLLASAFVKAKDPRAVLLDMANHLRV